MQDVFMQLGMVAAVIGSITAICGFAYAMYKIAKRIESAIGVDEEGKTLSERMTKVEYQLWENGGSSMKDQMNETTELAKKTAVEVGFIKQVMLHLVELPDITYVKESAQEDKAVAKRGSKKAKNPAQ